VQCETHFYVGKMMPASSGAVNIFPM